MAELYPTAPQVVDPLEVAVSVPHYAKFNTTIVAAGKECHALGKLTLPSAGVTIHEETHQIFVVDGNHRVAIFSETGEFLNQLGVGQLSDPWGIATHGDSLYVSCVSDHTVSKFSLIEMCHVRRIGGHGLNNGQFDSPHQLTTDLIGHVFIADTYNNRISIHDPDLNHLRNITHESIQGPFDIKVSSDRLYVLCPDYSPCIQVLTLEGDKLNSLITCGKGMDVYDPWFFCLDPLNNIVISEYDSHSIRVFSPEGNLLHKIGRKGHQPGMFYLPQGVAVTPNRRLVCVSINLDYGLQIFS